MVREWLLSISTVQVGWQVATLAKARVQTNSWDETKLSAAFGNSG